ncbi:Craniofacial development protein 1 [Choanephora cucurbitarum]|uniref:SWR1-complex protein 5 n=1 Tax=Choanephora cucurbitarum TaxID=101091 RepID=A0A1C7NFR6_9FUNG|nr:Craniofacial development protein 1 [Choanephora cucurbitarum]
MSLLRDLYTESDVEESEDDQDYVPEDESEEDDHQIEEQESDIEEDKKTQRRSSQKRKLSDAKEKKEDESTKKTRIDAIWKEMNTQTSTEKQAEKQIEENDKADEEPAEQIKETPKTSKQKPTMRRPKSNLSSLVSKYNIKEPKMNTLEKSKLDWQGYVDREGIRDELKYKNKDGYMEKVAFLQRVDDRRLSQLKEGQKKERKDQ